MNSDVSAVWNAEPHTPSFARALITTYLSRQDLDDLIPTAALLVSELVTNCSTRPVPSPWPRTGRATRCASRCMTATPHPAICAHRTPPEATDSTSSTLWRRAGRADPAPTTATQP